MTGHRRKGNLNMSTNRAAFLTRARKIWLASFFKNATVVIVAGIAGSEVFLKLPLFWKIVLVLSAVVGFLVGLIFATEDSKGI